MSTLQPHQERVIAERDDLASKISKLGEFIASEKFASVDSAERVRLMRQKSAQSELLRILNERIAAFTPGEDFELGTACDLSGDGICESCQ